MAISANLHSSCPGGMPLRSGEGRLARPSSCSVVTFAAFLCTLQRRIAVRDKQQLATDDESSWTAPRVHRHGLQRWTDRPNVRRDGRNLHRHVVGHHQWRRGRPLRAGRAPTTLGRRDGRLTGTVTSRNPATGQTHRLQVRGGAIGPNSTWFYLMIPNEVGPGGVIVRWQQGTGEFRGAGTPDRRTWPGVWTSATGADAAPIFGPGEHSVTLAKQ